MRSYGAMSVTRAEGGESFCQYPFAIQAFSDSLWFRHAAGSFDLLTVAQALILARLV